MKAPQNFVQRLNGATFSSNGFGFLIEVTHEDEVYIMPDTDIDFHSCILVKNHWDSEKFDVRICELGMGNSGKDVQTNSNILRQDINSVKDYLQGLTNITTFYFNQIIRN